MDPQQASYVAEFMSLGQIPPPSSDQDQKRQHVRKSHKSASERPLVAVVAPSSQPGPMPGQAGGGMMPMNAGMDYGPTFINTNCSMDQAPMSQQMWGNSPMMSRSPGGSQGPFMNSPNSMMQNNWNGGQSMEMGNRFPQAPPNAADRPGPIHDFVRQRLAGHCNNRQQQQLQQTQRPSQYPDYQGQPPQQKGLDPQMQEPPRSQPPYMVDQGGYADPSFPSPRSNMVPGNSPRQSAAIMPMSKFPIISNKKYRVYDFSLIRWTSAWHVSRPSKSTINVWKSNGCAHGLGSNDKEYRTISARHVANG